MIGTTIDHYLERATRDPISGCVLYGPTPTTYAHARIAGRWVGLHRLVLELRVGAKLGLRRGLPIPPGRMALHRPTCVGRSCIEPTHIRSGTAKDNAQDAILAGTANRGERNGRSKLSRSDVRAIRAAPRTAQARRELAETFDIDVAHVRAIQGRRFWRWLDAERPAA